MRTFRYFACLSLLSGAASGCSFGTESEPAPFIAEGVDGETPKPSAADASSGGAAADANPGAKPGTNPGTKPVDATGADDASAVPDMQPVRGAAVAISPDDSLALVANRDVGSVSLFSLSYDKQAVKGLQLIKELSVGQGTEPYQVAFAPDGKSAYVVLRRERQLLKLGSLGSAPAISAKVAVGSEPTAVALSADGRSAYVPNWNDGTLSVIETESMKLARTIDLNEALVKTGYLGTLQPRAALAHPRSVAVGPDALYVTEFFAQQVEAELSNGSNSDTRKVGLVYKVALPSYAVSTISLAALSDMGFPDENGAKAGCYPNQLQSIALNGDYAYVVSVCASPKGPLGVKVTATACTAASECSGLVEPACITPFAGAPGNVCVDLASVKTTTAPVLSIIDLKAGRELSGSALSLNASFDALFRKLQTEPGKQRMPLFASEIAFVPGTGVGYVSANGADAVFRFEVDAKSGLVRNVGGSTNPFIDLSPAGIAADKAGKNPIGLSIGHTHKKMALVANDVSRNLSVLDFDTQAIAGGVTLPQVVASAALPQPGSEADKVLRGKRFFNTGTGRWSLRGQGWGACQSCHADGLSDNVTWYFARGPRQSTSLDGSFASTHPEDQRIFNWTGIFDEVADFEANTRGVSGGVGAIVSAVSAPPQTADRIDLAGLGHAGLSGSASAAADIRNPLSLAQGSKLADWAEIEKYMQTIRSPRAPTTLEAHQVALGRELFADGQCAGCHSGEKWTVSRRFYTPGVETNKALSAAPLALTADFPLALLPAREPQNQTLRFAGGNAAAFDQILCALRPVGTFNVAEAGVGIAELRADMKTVAQGDGNPAGEGRGYNVPSLLGVASGAPYLHAGNARTLEALFSSSFAQHHHALAPNFLTESDESELQRNVNALVQYVLSIDEQSEYPAIPQTGASGGSLCPQSF